MPQATIQRAEVINHVVALEEIAALLASLITTPRLEDPEIVPARRATSDRSRPGSDE